MLTQLEEAKMNATTITLTSKNGREVVFTDTGRDVTAYIPALGLSLGGVEMTDNGIASRFLVNVGGTQRRVEAQFGEEELVVVRKVFDVMLSRVKEDAAFEAEMERRRDQVLRGMNG